jgi:hypothetical protein
MNSVSKSVLKWNGALNEVRQKVALLQDIGCCTTGTHTHRHPRSSISSLSISDAASNAYGDILCSEKPKTIYAATVWTCKAWLWKTWRLDVLMQCSSILVLKRSCTPAEDLQSWLLFLFFYLSFMATLCEGEKSCLRKVVCTMIIFIIGYRR